MRTDGRYSYGGVHSIPPNGSAVLATVGTNSSYYDARMESRLWAAEHNGLCNAFED